MQPGGISPEIAQSLWLVFIGGLAGSAHCIGMCGPLVALVESSRKGKWYVWSQLPMHAGRLTTLAALGLVAGMAGDALKRGGLAVGLQGAAAITGGTLMIVLAMVMSGWLPWRKVVSVSEIVLTRFVRVLASRHPLSSFGIGLYWGLLPCGLIWAWLLGAATATGSALGGALVMVVFGVGTMPALLVIGGLSSILSSNVKAWFNRIGIVTVLLMGVLLLLRGAASAGWIGRFMIAPGIPLF